MASLFGGGGGNGAMMAEMMRGNRDRDRFPGGRQRYMGPKPGSPPGAGARPTPPPVPIPRPIGQTEPAPKVNNVSVPNAMSGKPPSTPTPAPPIPEKEVTSLDQKPPAPTVGAQATAGQNVPADVFQKLIQQSEADDAKRRKALAFGTYG